MSRFKHTHLSSRYDRSPDLLRRAVASYATAGASIITLTEVDSERREKALRMEGWGVKTGDKTGRDDCGILWRESDWNALHKETINVAEYMAGNIGASIVVLQDANSYHCIVVGVVHLPSSVQGKGKVSGSRAPEWFLARRRTVRRMKKLKRRYDADSMMLVADWNICLKKRWVRVLIKSLHPSWRLVWKNMPEDGTHGSRLIDFTLIKGKVRVSKRPSIHHLSRVSDHKAYSETLAFTD